VPRTFETYINPSIQTLQREVSEGLDSILVLNGSYTILDGSHCLSTLRLWVERQRSDNRSAKPVRSRIKGARL